MVKPFILLKKWNKKSKVLNKISFAIMALTRNNVNNVIMALANEELHYWADNPNEWYIHCLCSSHLPTKPFDPAVVWDGYHWNFVRCLAQANQWEDMKQWVKPILGNQ